MEVWMIRSIAAIATLFVAMFLPLSSEAKEADPPKKDFDEPSMSIRSSSSVVPNTGAIINGRLMFESVDGSGKRYSVEYDPATSSVVAISGNNVISKTFTPQELAIAEGKANQAYGAGLAPVILVPLFMGIACYTNDQFTKHEAIRHCERQGRSVVMDDTGICGFSAKIRCENIDPPPVPTPAPTPVPGPSTAYQGIWLANGNGVGASDYWSVWTYDDDWF
jgi:hypothetical protein